MSDKAGPPDSKEPKVFSVKKVDGQWSLDRREFMTSVGAGITAVGGAATPVYAAETSSNVIFAHSDLVLGLALSGNQLVSGGKDTKIKLWVLPEGSISKTAKKTDGHSGAVAAIVWDPQGRFIVSGGADSKIIFWKPDLSSVLTSVKASGAVKSLSVSADGNHLVAAVGNRIAQYAVTGSLSINVEHARDIDAGVAINALVFTTHDNQYWCACADGRILVHSANDAQPVKSLRKHRGQLRACAFNANLKLVATGGADRVVRIWDPKSFEELSSFSAHESDIRSLAFNDEGDRLACASWDDSASVWNVNGPSKIHDLLGHAGDVNVAVFSADSRYLYTGSDDKSIIQWDLSTGKIVKRLIDLEASPKDAEGVKYKVTSGSTTTTYTLPCGSPIPAGAVCTCNCVSGSWSVPSSTPKTRTYSYHYWYPN